MKKRLNMLILAILWCLSPSFADRSGEIYKFERVDISDELPQVTVGSIIQDQRGFMWFATAGGLLKFDGHRSRVYSYIPGDTHSLSGNEISTVFEDSRGYLWIGVMGSGLDRFDPVSETFLHFEAGADRENSLIDNYVVSIREDQRGDIWIGSHGTGLTRLRQAAGRTGENAFAFTHYVHNPGNANSISSNIVWTICPDRSGDIWAGTAHGLNRFEPGTETFTRFYTNPRDPATISSNRIRCIYQDNSGVIWIGTTDAGLNRLEVSGEPGTNPTIKRFSADPQGTSNRSGNYIWTILEDSQKNLWIGTIGSGLQKFDRQTGEFQSFRYNPTNRRSLSSDQILSLCEDRTGSLWIGTSLGMVHKLNPNSRHFLSFRLDDSKDHNQSDFIFALYEDRAGNLWAGGNQGRITRMGFQKDKRPPDRVIRPITLESFTVSNSTIRAILHDRWNNFWIGTTQAGLFRTTPENLKTGKFQNFRLDPTAQGGIGGEYIMAIHEDRLGNLWIGTRDSGIYILTPENRETGVFTPLPNLIDDPHGLSHPYIRAIYEDQEGTIWVGTYSGGLNRYDRSQNRFVYYRFRENDPTSISSDCVMSILEDRAGNMWIGTGNAGLNKFDRESGTFKWYTRQDGLPDHMIYGMLEDERGNLWLSTNRGLSKFDPKKETFVNFSARDGLQDNEFNADAYYKNTATGQLFFGGIRGITTFHPRAIKMNNHIPPVQITSFRVLNREKSRGLVENGSEIILSHRENMFSFEYVVLDFNDPRKNQSAYMLEGFHDQWIHTDWTNRVATFTNIPPGQYKFRVKGSNNHGVWNEEAISVSLVITPPFWQTWWFRALAVLLLSLFILLLHARRMRNLKARLKTEYEITRIYSKCGMTPREIEIIDLLKRKKSYKEIEDELFISYHTVKNHIYNIFKKLGVDNRAELIYYFKSIEDEMKRSDK